MQILPHHPLDHPGVVKLLLSRAASDALAELGPFHLILASRADCTAPPEARGRFILICQPLDKATADDAAAVALGNLGAGADWWGGSVILEHTRRFSAGVLIAMVAASIRHLRPPNRQQVLLVLKRAINPPRVVDVAPGNLVGSGQRKYERKAPDHRPRQIMPFPRREIA